MILTIIPLYFTFCMLAVIYFDVTRYIIPNWLVGSLLLLYPIAQWLTPGELQWETMAAAVLIFAVGYFIFAMKWMGGGDIKLITVCALWVGYQQLAEFLIITAMLGGVFAAFLWGIRKVLPHMLSREKPLPRILREGEPVPYGVAIAFAMLHNLYLA